MTTCLSVCFSLTCDILPFNSCGYHLLPLFYSGWHNLETSYAAYRALIEGFGGRYVHLIHSPQSSPGAWSTFIGAAGQHLNRYVRQAACELIGVIGQCSLTVPPSPPPITSTDSSDAPATFPLLMMDEEGASSPLHPPLGLLSRVLAAGLEDSWCQVRLAATQAAEVLLRWVKHLFPPSAFSAVPSSAQGVDCFVSLWKLLVPRLCLNRHYSTDSVRYGMILFGIVWIAALFILDYYTAAYFPDLLCPAVRVLLDMPF